MKLMFASDIHGSELWCRKMLEAFEREGADKLCILGDFLYHGPRNDLPEGHAPKQVISLLNAVKSHILGVRGNCDTEVDQMVLDFPILQDSTLIYADGLEMYLTHGHRQNPENLPPLHEGAVMLYGHTHIPKAERVAGIHCLGIGSVALPKENTPHSYVIYENGEFIWKDLKNPENAEFMRYTIKNKGTN